MIALIALLWFLVGLVVGLMTGRVIHDGAVDLPAEEIGP